MAIGHECVAEVVAVGAAVERVRIGPPVIVPWAVSCGTCAQCMRGLTSKRQTTTQRTLAADGFGPASGSWGGMIADTIRGRRRLAMPLLSRPVECWATRAG